jgi:hypothetical protein
MNPADVAFYLAHGRVLEEVNDERIRQNNHRDDEAELPDGTSSYVRDSAIALQARMRRELAEEDGTLTWRHLVAEKVAFAFTEVDETVLRRELVSLAGYAAGWVEAIDARVKARG